ncbi:hypothetical protein FH972_010282 [Carpinus fangiana]|uniref:Uncharacterized protein n=1 Tax=Carpinus fangiana TaxID=176857 RepID=A0A660KMS9_9ROSI|nr:hypothetical protein FH972_010282 [Carpinus fangiana]
MDGGIKNVSKCEHGSESVQRSVKGSVGRNILLAVKIIRGSSSHSRRERHRDTINAEMEDMK